MFAKAREKARQTSCLSNVKQIGLGVSMYAQDFDEKLPIHCPPWPAYDGTNPHPCWAGQIYPYVKNTQMYGCPSANLDANMGGQTSVNGSVYPVVPRSYGWNFALNTISLGRVQFPAELIAVADSSCDNPNPGWAAPAVEQRCGIGYLAPLPRNSCCQAASPWGRACFRHNGGANCAFADGHAKWMNKSGDVFGNNGRTRYWQPAG